MKTIISTILLLACLAQPGLGQSPWAAQDLVARYWYDGNGQVHPGKGPPPLGTNGVKRGTAWRFYNPKHDHYASGDAVSELHTGKVRYTITITTLTNTVSGDNSSGCVGLPQTTEISPGVWSTTLPWHQPHEGCKPYVAPTEKWEITTVVRRRVIEFESGSFPAFLFSPITNDVVLSSKTNRWVLKADWVPKEEAEPKIEALWWNGSTNGSSGVFSTAPMVVTDDLEVEPITIEEEE